MPAARVRQPDDIYAPNWIPRVSGPALRGEIRELIMTDTLSEELKSILYEIYQVLPMKAE